VSATNLKNKHNSSASGGTPVNSATPPAGGGRVGSIPAPALSKTCVQNIGNEETSNEFLAELCKAEKGVPKDKRKKRRTEIVTGV
jgi:hypothetical protein